MRKYVFGILCLFMLPLSLVGQVYDCFLFFNELELLEIRLNELYPYVDKFVIVEACETHRKADPKPFNFELNRERFAQFADKIIYVKLEEHFETHDKWEREYWQRNQIMRGLTGCQPLDIIMISDVDEIVPGAIIPRLRLDLRKYGSIVCMQKMYRFFLNRACDFLWAGPGIVYYKDLQQIKPQGVRHAARSCTMGWRYHVGWHFSSVGGTQRIVEKYQGVSEGWEVKNPEFWRGEVDMHRLVPIDESFPKFVRENMQYMIDLGLIDIVSTSP